jgi:hypothetical protein
MISTKLFFEDSILREAAIKPRATQLLENLSKALKTVCPSAPGFQVVDDLQDWAETMLNLKRTFMFSDKDYRIHFPCPSPDRNSDPNWMEAITADGCPLKEDASVEDALTSNRKFFASFEERDIQTRSCIAKAHVLLM